MSPRKVRLVPALLLSLILISTSVSQVQPAIAAESAISQTASEAVGSVVDLLPPSTESELLEAVEIKTLKIDGSSAMTVLNQALKQRFEQAFPDTEVTIDAQGTEAALQKLIEGDIDLAAIGRSLTTAEKVKGLKEIPISQERIAVIVGKENPFKGDLTVEQFTQIFQGKITDWSEVGGVPGRIWVIDRPENSDTRLALSRYGISRALLTAATGAIADAAPRPESATVEPTDESSKTADLPSDLPSENIIRLETDDTAAVIRQLGKDGISYAIASQLAGQNKARIVKLAVLHEALPDDPLYPYAQTRGYAYKQGSAATAFVDFATAEPGQAIVTAAKSAEAAAIASALKPAPKLPSLGLFGKDAKSEARPEPLADPQAKVPDTAPERSLSVWWWLLPLVLLGAVLGWLRSQWLSSQQADDAPEDAASEAASEPIAPAPVIELPADAQTLFAQGMALLGTDRPTEAIIYLAKAVEIQPDFPEAWVGKGKTLLKLERLEEALSCFNQATELNATLPEAWIGKGDVLTKLGLPEEAQTSYRRSTEPVGRLELVAEPEAVAEPEVAEPEATELVEPEVAEPVAVAEPSAIAPFTVAALKSAFLDNLSRLQGKSLETATPQDCYLALAALICDRLLQFTTPEDHLKRGDRLVGEFSAEYMPGLHLAHNLLSLDISDSVAQAMRELNIDLDDLLEQEEEPGLGRGGLGRLMVCYLDALATAEVPAIGYGIRYEYGIFDQEISSGWQIEIADEWLRNGNPWEVERPEAAVQVQFGGRTEAYMDAQNGYRVRWVADEVIQGIPYDTPIPGYKSSTVNFLRLWKAEAAENLSKVLYPSDMEFQGKLVRLKQQFFFVSCSLQDIIRMHLNTGASIETLPDRFALQLNDTDPLMAIVELMRLLIDEHDFSWEQAWHITQSCFAYTNHSLLPEALDYTQYTLHLVGSLLPRHLEIIFELNTRFLEEVRSRYPEDEARVQRLSLIDEAGDRYVRMVYLACLGSHAINGVSSLHTAILQHLILPDFYELYPEKFSSKTNGVSLRRFLALSNPRLADLITSKIGDRWIAQPDQLSNLEAFADDAEFRSAWGQVKQAMKQALADQIQQQNGLTIDVDSLFDVQAIEIHEHKRQHLNLLHIITLYNRIKANPHLEMPSRTFIFSGKVAPDYSTAKLIIKLIHAVAEVVNTDPAVQGRIKVVFLKDFTIQLSQKIYPATDLAEYISTAGTEACGIGNMITVMNGGLLIGTRDGSNLEIRDAIGTDHFFQFGLTVNDILAQRPSYEPRDVYNREPELKQAIDQIAGGYFSNGDTELFQPLVHLMLNWDAHLLLADYASYVACQEQVSQVYADRDRWIRMTILSAARMGKFSADFAVQEYCRDIWGITPESVEQWQYTQV
ncbi:MAG TPA: glycogen/starch/alpha-glucan family phosphorylase [Coleofasciculaceae cyanobacterium]|jgi:starch phosphorylase